jgi:hypothetical protein
VYGGTSSIRIRTVVNTAVNTQSVRLEEAAAVDLGLCRDILLYGGAS